MKKTSSSVQDITSIAIMTAITVVLAQISIPMPMGVPMTLQTFAVILGAVILGSKRSAIAMIVYLLLGAVGVPVFSGFTGGLSRLIGPTGGFLLSFPIMAFLIGLGITYRKKKGVFLFFLILGIAVNYAVGVAMFCLIMNASWITGLTACVLPFIPTDIIKAVLASALGVQIRERLAVALA